MTDLTWNRSDGQSAVNRAASATRWRARGAATAVAAALLLTAAGGTAGAQSTEYRVSIERGGTAAPRFSTPNRRSSYWLTVNVSSADELECLSFKAANTATPRPRRFVGTTGARDAGTCTSRRGPGPNAAAAIRSAST